MSEYIFPSMIVFAVIMTLLCVIVWSLGVTKANDTEPIVYEVKAVEMQGDSIVIEEGWEPFGVWSPANVIYVKRRKVDG
ncbi:MAG: hypothetical protein ACWGQW_03985 [bacterium]